MSDYWAYEQWTRIARGKFGILLIGDSAIWGQEVASAETISHCINATLGSEAVANLGIDGLSNAAMEGLFRYYGRHIRHANVILQFNPLWMSSPWRDMRENWIFHHPRLVRPFDRRIRYYRSLSERLGYLLEHYLRLPRCLAAGPSRAASIRRHHLHGHAGDEGKAGTRHSLVEPGRR
jgi:hypothetical protein